MTRLILAPLLWTSSLYAACPELAGRYECTYRGGGAPTNVSREPLVVTERRAAGVVTYFYNGSELITDDVERPLPDDQEMKQTTLRTWCDDAGQVRGRLRARYFAAGAFVGDLELLYAYAADQRNVRQITDGRLTGGAGTFPLNSDVTCLRIE